MIFIAGPGSAWRWPQPIEPTPSMCSTLPNAWSPRTRSSNCFRREGICAAAMTSRVIDYASDDGWVGRCLRFSGVGGTAPGASLRANTKNAVCPRMLC
jgi:hypothetical protein